MAWSDEKWMLHQVNASRKEGEEEITFENAKKANIPTPIRLGLEKSYGEQKVAKIFGEASHLQKAEMMILEIEEGELTKEEKYSNIIDIAYYITNACGKELDSNNLVWDKYAMLHTGIPIQMRQWKVQNSNERLSFLNLKKIEASVPAELLKGMHTRIVMQNEVTLEPEEEACYDYVFELVYISLKEIFKEVKAEIMGE